MNEILSSILSQMAPTIAILAVGFLIKDVLPLVADAAVSYLRKKEEAIANKVGIDTYNANLEKAKNVWNEVEEEFRITPALNKTIEVAQSLFRQKLLSIAPVLTPDEIDHLRQVVAGEVNKGREVLTAPIEPEFNNK